MKSAHLLRSKTVKILKSFGSIKNHQFQSLNSNNTAIDFYRLSFATIGQEQHGSLPAH